jgi:FKBP-type peptidyl-prolyl cis-trans isomerase
MCRTALVLSIALSLAGTAFAEEPATAAAPATKTSDQDLLYALGAALARNLAPLGLEEDDLTAVQEGLAAAVLGKDLRVEPRAVAAELDAFLRGRAEGALGREKEAGAAFRAKAAEQPGARTSESGIVYLSTTEGDGPSPGANDTVRVHYTGTLRDGTVFDTSRDGDAPTPAEFVLGEVVPCFRDGIGMMKVGGRAKIVCPPETAYGDRGSPPAILPGATISFDVDLLGVVGSSPAATPPPTAEEGGS